MEGKPGDPEYHQMGSRCCGAEVEKLLYALVQKRRDGTSYYYHQCSSCKKPCWTTPIRIWDSAGVEIKDGDILECPEDKGLATEYHAVTKDGHGLDIRDLGHNNTAMYLSSGKYFTRGNYKKHLDKLSDEDLVYYFHHPIAS